MRLPEGVEWGVGDARGAGILESVAGARGGYRLARPAGEIRVLDVVEALDGDTTSFRCTEIRRRGPAAVAAWLTEVTAS